MQQKGGYMEYISHIRENGLKQSVKDHCLETAKLCKEYGSTLEVSNMAYLQGVIHDVGKLTERFSKYIQNQSDDTRGSIDHSYAGAKYLQALVDKNSIKDTMKLYTLELVSKTIVSHHGLNDWINTDGEDYLEKRLSKNENYDEVSKNVKSIISDEEILELLDKASKEYSRVIIQISSLQKRYINSSPEPNRDVILKNMGHFYVGLFERLMQSILIDADWTNTADFMSNSSSSLECDIPKLWDDMCNNLEAVYKEFELKTDKVSKYRMDIANRCLEYSNHKVGICKLIVPTGGGKTLSASRFSVHYCKNFNMRKIVYVAPYMSILEQNSKEIRKIVNNDDYFLEHYSNVVQNIKDEDLENYRTRTQKWDSPVIATTMVQFFSTLFSNDLSCVRRMHELSNAVIILDEIQSIPVKCVHMFNLAMNFLSEVCGCTIVLCTATQPNFEEADYPILIDENSSMVGDYSKDFENFKRVNMISKVTECRYSYDEASKFCYDRFLENGNLLVVLNTKSSAKNMYTKLKDMCGSDVVVHLSTNMCPQHRLDIIDKVKKRLKDNVPIVCVTTQLIEAGVDISFKCVVRSFAGLDNAIQSAGRCNRHGEYDICNAYMIDISDESLNQLKSIQKAQTVSLGILGNKRLSEDLLSNETISEYFKAYYNNQRYVASNGKNVALSYPIKDLDVKTSLLDMLSVDSVRRGLLQVSQKSHIFYQAFATAGRNFKLIDKNTVSIIVPYNEEANRLIDRLSSDLRPNEIVKLLRKVQKYTIGIFQNSLDTLLKSGGAYYLNSNILVLQSCNYSQNFGLDIEAEDFEGYIF